MSKREVRLTLRHPGGEQSWTQGPVRVGRAPDNDLVLHDDSLSRHHAEIAFTRGGWTIRDLQSANGVWLGGVRIPSGKLRTGSEVTLGQVVLQVVEARDGSAGRHKRVSALGAAVAAALLALWLQQPGDPARPAPPGALDPAVFAARLPAPPAGMTLEQALHIAKRNLEQGLRTGSTLVTTRHALAWAARLNQGTLPAEAHPVQAELEVRLAQAFQAGRLAYVRARKLERRVDAEAAMRMLRETFPADDPRSVEVERLTSLFRKEGGNDRRGLQLR